MSNTTKRYKLFNWFMAMLGFYWTFTIPIHSDAQQEVYGNPSQQKAERLPVPPSKTSRVGIVKEVDNLTDQANTSDKFVSQKLLQQVQFDDVAMADAMKIFADETGLNIINSADAGKTRVTAFLKRVTAMDALDAIVKSNGLFYRKDDRSGIIRIATSREYERDLSTFREEETKVFTLLYPNPVAVAQVIQQILGNRVQYNAANSDLTDLDDLSQRFNRFDLVDGRALGLGASGGSAVGSSQQFLGNGQFGLNGLGANALRGGNGLNGLGNGNGLNGNLGLAGGVGNALNNPLGIGNFQSPLGSANSLLRNSLGSTASNAHDGRPLNDLSSDEIQQLENQYSEQGAIGNDELNRLLERKAATIFVSTIRRNNQIIVRTGDPKSMEQIEQLILQLDVPTPTVLLEVKVLRVQLTDGLNSAFEYFAKRDNAAGALSDGALNPAFPGGASVARNLTSSLAGQVPGALSFQMVDSNFQFRLQLLESKNRVTALATPLILTANNEVSRIFVGDTLPFTVGFTPSQVVASVNAVNGSVSATPITELRDVGQSLLITPNINADRTVTLRVVEENSERVLSGASIPIPSSNGNGVSSVSVDTVRRRTVSGTIVAQDGMAVAMGGLIEEQLNDSRDQIPILGELPGIGFLFRRQSTNRIRTELVVVIRPYVFNTPSESAAASRELLNELSLHPSRDIAEGTMNSFLPCDVVRADPECTERAGLFRLHNIVPKTY